MAVACASNESLAEARTVVMAIPLLVVPMIALVISRTTSELAGSNIQFGTPGNQVNRCNAWNVPGGIAWRGGGRFTTKELRERVSRGWFTQPGDDSRQQSDKQSGITVIGLGSVKSQLVTYSRHGGAQSDAPRCCQVATMRTRNVWGASSMLIDTMNSGTCLNLRSPWGWRMPVIRRVV